MAFREVKSKVIECLNHGYVLHEERGDIDVKNLLSTGAISISEVTTIIGRARGNTYSSSPHHYKYYIHALSNNEISSNNLLRYLKSDLAKGVAQKRISLKGRHLEEELILLKEIIKVESTTDLLKIVVLKINDDVLVNERQKPMGQLKNIMAATA